MILGLILACGTPDLCPVGPAPDPTMGDANGDGHVDLSDGTSIIRYRLAGGAAPACDGVADVEDDDDLNPADGFGLWDHLFAGGGMASLVEAACNPWSPPAAPDVCGGLAYTIDAPREATGAFTATVSLVPRDLAPEGWSLSVTATGCTITAATTLGTAAAHVTEDPPGRRTTGYEHTELTATGAVSAVVLDWSTQATLPVDRDGYAILSVEVEADACGTCTLDVGSGGQGSGEPVDEMISVEGRRYEPEAVEASIQACP